MRRICMGIRVGSGLGFIVGAVLLLAGCDSIHESKDFERHRYSQLSGLVMSAVYHATLQAIVARDFPVMRGRVRLPTWQKLWLVWRCLRQEKRRYRHNLRHGTISTKP